MPLSFSFFVVVIVYNLRVCHFVRFVVTNNTVAVLFADSQLDEEKLKSIVVELSSQDERQVSETN